jgi:hypothetical protein
MIGDFELALCELSKLGDEKNHIFFYNIDRASLESITPFPDVFASAMLVIPKVRGWFIR